MDNRSALAGRDRIAIVWEGSFFAYHSLANVNREMCLELERTGQVELSLLPYGSEDFDPSRESRLQPLSRAVRRPLGRPVEFHIRHQWPFNPSPPPEGKWIVIQPWEYGAIPKDWLIPFVAEIDEIWVPSEFNRQSYIRSGVPLDKIKVVPNGVNPTLFQPEGPQLALEGAKRWRFLFVGGTIPRKGIDILLQAYRLAFRAHDDVTLVIRDFGAKTFYRGGSLLPLLLRDWDYRADPHVLVLTEDLTEADMPRLYRTGSCLVHPYRGEGFGLPIAEAMACGLPVIVPRYGACLDYCTEETAFWVRAKEVTSPECRLGELETVVKPWWCEVEPEELARVMRYVYEHPEEAKARGIAASQKIRREFTWGQSARRALERLLALRGGEPLRVQMKRAGIDRTIFHPMNRSFIGGLNLLLLPDWNFPEEIAQALKGFLQAFTPDEEVTLLLPRGSAVEQTQNWVASVIRHLGYDPEKVPDIALIPPVDEAKTRAAAYRNADVAIIMGSKSEGGNSDASEARKLEAVACGCPAIKITEVTDWRALLHYRRHFTTLR